MKLRYILFMMLGGLCAIVLVLGFNNGMSQTECCCKGVVDRTCICFGFVDCIKEACGDVTEGLVPTCCDRYVNCSKLTEGCREIWVGRQGSEYSHIEYTTCE